MDNLRGTFDAPDSGDEHYEVDDSDTESSRDLPPAAIGQDERRMQVRAYNHWAGLLGDQPFPDIEALEPDALSDFGPYSVLLDFSTGVEDPAVRYLGDSLAQECGTTGDIGMLSDVPSRSLLSRITDHYMQILANQAPIGFEAEFVNQRSLTIMYRGILLPYSSDGETIDFIYGVINWKEIADQLTTDELLLEIDQVLDDNGIENEREPDPVTDWADGPSADLPDATAHVPNDEDNVFPQPDFGEESEDSQMPSLAGLIDPQDEAPLEMTDEFDPEVSPLMSKKPSTGPALFELTPADELIEEDEEEEFFDMDGEESGYAALDAGVTPAAEDIADNDANEAGLYDCLAEARELAEDAKSTEDRSRAALYAAVGRAYDVSIAAQDAPEDFAELLDENALTVQDRAPMTPIVKLVFGVDYDKTRLTEYATVLTHAHRANIGRGELAAFLKAAEGGLKGVVATERRLRREQAGERTDPVGEIRAKLAEKLRAAQTYALDDISADGPEFGVVMIRRMPDGQVVVVGEVSDDIPLSERVAKKLVA